MQKTLVLFYDCGCMVQVRKDSRSRYETCFFHDKPVTKALWKTRAGLVAANAPDAYEDAPGSPISPKSGAE